MNDTSIKYRGVVSVEFPTKRFISHNNGSIKLFSLLNKFMSRQTVSVGELPGYIMLYQTNSASVLQHTNANDVSYPALELLSSKLPAMANVVSVASGEVVVYTTPLTNSSLKSGITIGASTPVCLALISSDAKTILSATDVTGGSSLIKSLQQGMNATIKWQLSFENS